MCDSNETGSLSFDTKAIHAGQEHERWSNAEIVPPIVTSVTYYQKDPTNIFAGYCYGRDGNPTRDALARCLAALDNGKYGLIFPSGCATTTAVIHLLQTGDHILSCSETYGGTRTIFLTQAKMQGIEVDFVDSTNVELFASAIKPNTRLIWLETPSNPCLKISDIAAIAKAARSHKDIIFVVDNTLMTSYFQQPMQLGADIVMYSLTKYMNGHNDVLAGALVINDSKIYEDLKLIQVKFGLTCSPFDCFLVNRGLKTLPLRMNKHCENGTAVARYLEKHPKVVKVIHPGLPSHPQYELAKKQSSGYCGLVVVQLSGTINEATKFIHNLKVFLSSDSFGTCTSFAVLPAYASHIDVPKEVREQLGIFETTVRLSVGIENTDDLIKDLEQALVKTFE
ncbi:cystathionine gamma-lyase-like [Sitodiplosis mosellana]|uniref:cystathionine gamma-lyase-like n=1 Tax=Sitodiplosis mosellana TaxID=263140 RepID=UPI002444D3AB|nr:cystathionine gamma-lyase-like [Sitodiplosis mosellana]